MRLDDTDVERSTDEFAKGIVDDLRWLGLKPDRTEKQSDRFDLYDNAADKLREQGVLYPCYESPEEIERRRKRLMARGLPPVYDRAALKISVEERAVLEAEGQKPHWRFLLPNFEKDPFDTKRTDVQFKDVFRGKQNIDLASMSDPILIRGDGTYLYTLPSVVDDIDMGVSHVIRGGDHVTNTGAQIAIFEALGGPVPEFGHHNLLQDASGEGLSKRTGALSIASFNEDGLEPMSVASLATLIGTGQSVEVCDSLKSLAELFDPTKVSKSDSKFDAKDLIALNEKLLHEMSYKDAQPRLKTLSADLGEPFWLTVRANVVRFNDVVDWKARVEGDFEKPSFDTDDAEFISTAAKLLPAEPWGEDIWSQWTSAVKLETGRKGGRCLCHCEKRLPAWIMALILRHCYQLLGGKDESPIILTFRVEPGVHLRFVWDPVCGSPRGKIRLLY